MQFKPYAQSLVVAMSLAVMAGCSTSGGTQDGSTAGTTGTTGTTATSQTQGITSSQTSSSQMQQAAIPDERTIYFDFDRDTIRPEFEPVLLQHAEYLRANPNATVVLQGHGDERGTREYNLGLGERRAQSVERFLTLQGVSPSQLEVVSYGEERPAVDGHSEEAYAQNRRVIFDY